LLSLFLAVFWARQEDIITDTGRGACPEWFVALEATTTRRMLNEFSPRFLPAKS